MRLEYYTPLKKGFILQSKDEHFENICRRMLGGITFHSFTTASRGTPWPLHFIFASYTYVVGDMGQLPQVRQACHQRNACPTHM